MSFKKILFALALVCAFAFVGCDQPVSADSAGTTSGTTSSSGIPQAAIGTWVSGSMTLTITSTNLTDFSGVTRKIRINNNVVEEDVSGGGYWTKSAYQWNGTNWMHGNNKYIKK